MTHRPQLWTGRYVLEWAIVGGLLGALVVVLVGASSSALGQAPLDEWAVADGLALEVDASGFSLPTAIATVPEPGSGPDDPRYYVAELRGSIKAVTNDRSVVEIGSVPTVEPPRDRLTGSSQSGLAGLCVDPVEGFVFGTFAYPDDGGILRNDIVRLDTGPQLSTNVVAEQRFTQVFADFQSSAAHQIGGCHVDEGRLLVGVGDGGNTSAARDPGVLLGKLVCLTLDGDPCPDNPRRDQGEAAAYVYALGLRNPFGVEVVDGTVFVAENGRNIDRLLRVERGSDYLWDGSDASIAIGADVVFEPAVSPVQLDHLPRDHAATVGLDAFVFSVFNPEPATGIMTVSYDFGTARPVSVPRYLLQWVGEADQHVIPLAVGPAGIYTAGAFPGPDGTSEILRLHADGEPHPVMIVRDWGYAASERLNLLEGYGCTNCHAVDGQGGGIGPSLDGFGLTWRLRERLDTDEYEARVRQLNASEADDEWRVSAREAVIEVDGVERIRVWLEHFLQDPQFDNSDVLMPDPGLSQAEAQEIRDVLVPPPPGLVDRAVTFTLDNRRAVVFGFGLGALGAVGGIGLLTAAVWIRRRRDRGTTDPSAA